MKSIDKLNLIMGKNKIRFASQGFDEYWQATRKNYHQVIQQNMTIS